MKCSLDLMDGEGLGGENVSGRSYSHEQWQSGTLVVELFSIILLEES